MTADRLSGKHIVIHTDGSCLRNPGPGGWGAILSSHDGEKLLKRKELCGSADLTTNNRMEMTAAIKALEAIKTKAKPIVLRTDSQLLAKGVAEWLPRWKANGWKTAKGKQVENADLWRKLDRLNREYPVRWEWVPRDSTSLNRRADQLAHQQASATKEWYASK